MIYGRNQSKDALDTTNTKPDISVGNIRLKDEKGKPSKGKLSKGLNSDKASLRESQNTEEKSVKDLGKIRGAKGGTREKIETSEVLS